MRARGQTLPVHVTVGRSGLTPGVMEEIQQEFARRDLVKIRCVSADASKRNEWAREIADRCQAETVGGVGRNLLFWRTFPADET